MRPFASTVGRPRGAPLSGGGRVRPGAPRRQPAPAWESLAGRKTCGGQGRGGGACFVQPRAANSRYCNAERVQRGGREAVPGDSGRLERLRPKVVTERKWIPHGARLAGRRGPSRLSALIIRPALASRGGVAPCSPPSLWRAPGAPVASIAGAPRTRWLQRGRARGTASPFPPAAPRPLP